MPAEAAETEGGAGSGGGDPDPWTAFGRGLGYWLVLAAALQAGAYYGTGVRELRNHLVLLAFSLLLYPFYVIWAHVYDSGTGRRARRPAVAFFPRSAKERVKSWLRRYIRGRDNSWTLAVPFFWGSAIFLLVLIFRAGALKSFADYCRQVDGLGFLLLLFAANFYYAFWVLWMERNDNADRNLVRNETFIPVLIVAFSFFVGATVFEEGFSSWLYPIPVAIFVFLYALNRWHNSGRSENDEAPGGRLAYDRYARWNAGLLLLGPVLVWVLGKLELVGSGAARHASLLLVSFAVGLYLSLFELWRLTALAPETAQRERYFDATLASHAVALAGLPILFVFGSFGLVFLVVGLVHAVVVLFAWYLWGSKSSWIWKWKFSRVVAGFFFLGIIFADRLVDRLPGGAAELRDLYPSGFSGVSASLLVAVLFAFFATPLLEYLGRAIQSGREMSISKLLMSRFSSLRNRREVFTLAAALCGVFFVVCNATYETVGEERHTAGSAVVALKPVEGGRYEVTVTLKDEVGGEMREDGTVTGQSGVARRAGLVFWLYAAGVALFGALAFFFPSGGGGDKSGGGESLAVNPGTRSLAMIVVGVLQTLRVATGAIVFLGVYCVGRMYGATSSDVLLLASAVTFVVAASFAINDYYDWKRDAINATHRAVPTGKLRRHEALVVGIAALVIGVLLGLRAAEGVSLVVFLAGCLGASVYNEFVRRAPQWKTLMTAALSALIIVFDIEVFDLPTRFYWVALSCFVMVLGRELLMDVRDLRGDRAAGLATLASRAGRRTVERAGFALVGLSLIPALGFLSGASPSRWALVLVAAYVASVCSGAAIWFLSGKRRREWISVEILKVPLLVGVGLMLV